MTGSHSWFSRKAPRRKSTRSVKASHGNLQADTVISGRITKQVSNKGKSYESPVKIKYEDEEVEALATGAQSSQVVEENEDIGEDDVLDTIEESNDNEGGGEGFSEGSIEDEIIVRTTSPLSSTTRETTETNESLSGKSRQSNPVESSASKETIQGRDTKEGWRFEQVFLNQVLKARDEYTLMPTTWRMHFRGVPLPDGLFYIKTHAVSARPRIYARTDKLEYQGATALRKLMDIHGRVRDLRREQRSNQDEEHKRRCGRRLVDHIKQALTQALRWSATDGNIRKYRRDFEPNIVILEMNDENKSDMDVVIETEITKLSAWWRDKLALVPGESRPEAPVLFGFVIFKHIVFIVTMDAQNPNAVCHVPCQLNLSEENQYQWNALAIMATICWARDLYISMMDRLLVGVDYDEGRHSSDPDA
ncbi:uncharacterized protein F4812DRAFT_418413 [Daldinia caldariorum]|uniref:uncharacterized protein n=1 Tax=Daldinia caldariorum TaxID=326644 RepID=UPI002007FD43|nr:uncharacterized protein F4812DRAFT_418413 [Daldinia caldariorum]KAI1470632.1 hypothetical protein F4812DRAFT_418413 [Daldinia caldariorum]